MSRLDKWLFHARFCRTRALAQAAAAAGPTAGESKSPPRW